MRQAAVVEQELDRLRSGEAAIAEVMDERAQLTQQAHQAQLDLARQAAEIAQLRGTADAAREHSEAAQQQAAASWEAEVSRLRGAVEAAEAWRKLAEAAAGVSGAREAEAKGAAEAAWKLAAAREAEVVKLRDQGARKEAAEQAAVAKKPDGAVAAAEQRAAMLQADVKQLQADNRCCTRRTTGSCRPSPCRCGCVLNRAAVRLRRTTIYRCSLLRTASPTRSEVHAHICMYSRRACLRNHIDRQIYRELLLP